MKTLLILRHAKSSWKRPDLDDHDRPLNARGRRDAPRMGALLRRRGLTPDLVVSSTAVRARTTAEQVAEESGYGGQVTLDRRLYLAAPEALVDVVGSLGGGAARVLVVGHNPGLEDLLARLTGAAEALPTAALAQVALPIAAWRELRASTRGRLVALWRPKELDEPDDPDER